MKKIFFASFLAAFLAAFVLPGAATAKTEREVLIETFAHVSQSVGALYSLSSGGDLSFLCSATAIDRQHGKTVILTANHCVRKGVSYLINFGDNNFRRLSVWKVPRYDINPNKYPRRYNESVTDIALFLMEGTDIPLVHVSGTSMDQPGSKVAMVGFPLGVAKIRYEGIISGYLNRPGSDEDGYLLLQIFGAPGSSGSAVVSVDSGKIIGVLVAAQGSGMGLPVIFATPIYYMGNLMIVPGAAGESKKE